MRTEATVNDTMKLATTACIAALLLGFGRAQAAGPSVFASPTEAADALVTAARAGDQAALESIFGPDSHDLFYSGDPVADRNGLERFAEWAGQRMELDTMSDGSVEIAVGDEDWPLPIPLVKRGDGWIFDTAAGKDELINRRIGANELSAIDVCRALVDAELVYASRDRDGDGVNEFTPKFFSDPGTQDGLFWKAAEHGGEASPIGPLAATASEQGYKRGGENKPTPYHGYFFRVLSKQGKNAPGGAKDYEANGNLTKGFAVLAHPADYGSSGVMTFLINRNGILFQNDLGEDTEKIASRINSFDPDDTWTVVKD
jgi:hypothetical protein